MTLPTEVRHRIYKELQLVSKQQPIWLRHHVPISALFGTSTTPVCDPIFQTQIFRLNREIRHDATMFAYGFNDFQIREDFSVFCGLGSMTLSCIRRLVILPTMWRYEGPKEREMWSKLQHCENLQRLEIYLHPEVLLPTIRFFRDLSKQLKAFETPPRIVLDLCVWARHLSYDLGALDYERSRTLLESEDAPEKLTPALIDPYQRVSRLPLQTPNIFLSADFTAAAVKALDDHLGTTDRPLFRKTVADLPEKGTRAIGGRSERLCYELQIF